jgi:hypothetical protein
MAIEVLAYAYMQIYVDTAFLYIAIIIIPLLLLRDKLFCSATHGVGDDFAYSTNRAKRSLIPKTTV